MATSNAKQPDFTRTLSVTEAVFIYNNNEAHSSKMLKAIRENWEKKEYCDLELIVGIQEKKVSVHKLIMVSACDYFNGLLSSNMLEGKQASVKCLEHLQSAAVIKLIEYCYSGGLSIKIPSEIQIEHLLEAADYMRLQGVCQEIAKFLESHLNDENCLGYLQCADHYSLKTLRTSAWKHACQNYMGITKTEEFALLPLPFLQELLESDYLVVQHSGIVIQTAEAEAIVCDSVIEYVGSDRKSRLPQLPKLLKLLKLPLVTKEQLNKLEANEFVKNDRECLEIMQQAKKTKPLHVTDVDGENWAKPRKNQGFLLREFQEYAGGGQVQPETSTFNCRDILKDDHFAFISGMKIGIRRWDGRPVIGGMEVFYSNGQKPHYGMKLDECETVGEFHLVPNERIDKVDIQAGYMMDNLYFHTNLGNNYGPYGGEGGGSASEQPPTNTYAYLAGLSGTIVESQEKLGITRLKFMWGFYNFNQQQHQQRKEVLVDASLLYIYRGYYGYGDGGHIDPETQLEIKQGNVLCSLTEGSNLDTYDRRGEEIEVIHCHSGKVVKIVPQKLRPYASSAEIPVAEYVSDDDSWASDDYNSDDGNEQDMVEIDIL